MTIPTAVPVAAAGARSRVTVRSAVGPLTARRWVQLVLGVIWLIDAALQYQPYMFTKAFVTNTVASAASGNPMVVAHPIDWAGNIMIHDIAVYNAAFATLQLLIAVGLFFRPTTKAALAISIPWAVSVWWFGEGLGGVLTGAANPFTGAPGAVILYAFIALLVWPVDDHGATDLRGQSVATSGVLAAAAPRVLVLSLWASFIYFMLETVNRNSPSLVTTASGMDAGEPGWVQSLDHALGNAITGNATMVAFVSVVLFAVAGIGLFVPRLVRLAVVVGVAVGLGIWILEDFGAIFTGQGTDVNSGLLVALLAATFWPTRRPEPPGAHRASPLSLPSAPASGTGPLG